MIKWLLYLEFVSLMIELCEFDFEPFNTDKKVSSLEQFLLHMNEDDIFDSFPWYWKRNCIRCCLYCVCVTPTQQRYCTQRYKNNQGFSVQFQTRRTGDGVWQKNLLSANSMIWGKQG